MISVNDELNGLKSRMQALGLRVTKFEKIGNGNMSAFRVYFYYPDDDVLQEGFFWRHDMDTFEERMKIKLQEKAHQ